MRRCYPVLRSLCCGPYLALSPVYTLHQSGVTVCVVVRGSPEAYVLCCSCTALKALLHIVLCSLAAVMKALSDAVCHKQQC